MEAKEYHRHGSDGVMIFQDHEDKSGTIKFNNVLRKIPFAAFDSVMTIIQQNSVEMEVLKNTKRGSSAFNLIMKLCQAWVNGWTRGTGKTASIVVGRLKNETELESVLFIALTDDVSKLLSEVKDVGQVASVQCS